MQTRIGILTGGGDCPGLNAVIRAVVKTAAQRGWQTIGILGGFEGLLSPVRTRPLDYHEMDGLLFVGGTILGTSNKGHFAAKTGHGETRRIPEAVLDEACHNFKQLGLRALVVVGGDGSLSIAQQLFEHGMPVVGVPKTIDNDIEATEVTFGFDSAVHCATDALDRLRTTAASHDRVMVLEVMGRYAGWIAVHAGIAGGGDVILIPEIPFRYESICEKIADRERAGKKFTLVVVAEGARWLWLPRVPDPKAALFRLLALPKRTARRGSAASGRSLQRKSKSGPEKKRGCVCWAICSAVVRQRASIVFFARVLARMRSDWSKKNGMVAWLPIARPRLWP